MVTNEQRSRFSFVSLAAVLTGVFVVFGAGYLLGKDTADSLNDQLTREIDLFKAASNNQNALDYLGDLKLYNDNLFNIGQYVETIHDLKSVNEELSGKIETLGTELKLQIKKFSNLSIDYSVSKSEIVDLRNIIRSTYELQEEFELKENQSKPIFDGRESFGVSSIYGSYLSGTFQNKTIYVNVGERIIFDAPENKCQITYLSSSKIGSEDSAKFSLICTANQDE